VAVAVGAGLGVAVRVITAGAVGDAVRVGVEVGVGGTQVAASRPPNRLPEASGITSPTRTERISRLAARIKVV
jgi:hypothetical protein